MFILFFSQIMQMGNCIPANCPNFDQQTLNLKKDDFTIPILQYVSTVT